MKRIFGEAPLVSFRRPKNLKDELVRSKIGGRVIWGKGMRKCSKVRCQICKYVREGRSFKDSSGNREYYVNYDFDCDSKGVVYLIECKKCIKLYVGSTITSFRKRFNNHKSSLVRHRKGQRGITGEHLYAHFFQQGHQGLDDIKIMIIDKTDVSKLEESKGFWVYILNTLIPDGLNLRDFN